MAVRTKPIHHFCRRDCALMPCRREIGAVLLAIGTVIWISMPHPNPVDNGRQATITEPAKPVSPLAKPAACGGVVLASLASRSAAPLSAQEECALKPKDEFKECPTCPVMVVVPSGSFTMGSPASEPERSSDEGPQHQVTIGKAFAVGKFAVTFEEWDACVAGGGCNGYRPEDQGWGRGKQPVINVSWNDAKAYIAWLSNKTGKTYRLLSESEWEYTARAGRRRRFVGLIDFNEPGEL